MIQEISKHKEVLRRIRQDISQVWRGRAGLEEELYTLSFALRVLGMMDVDKIMNIIISYNHKIVANGQQPITEEDELAHSILTGITKDPGLTSQEGEKLK